jgi:ankyrin repeat protein
MHIYISCIFIYFLGMKTLLEAGADPNARQPLTLAGPLHLACLRSVEGSQNAQDNDTNLLEDRSAKSGKSRGKENQIKDDDDILALKIQLLLDFGAEVDLKDQADMTPLHAACLAGQSTRIVKLLLSNGADPNVQDKSVCVNAGWTPLHHLAAGVSYDPRSTVEIGQTLLTFGADPSIRGRWIENVFSSSRSSSNNSNSSNSNSNSNSEKAKKDITHDVVVSSSRERKPVWLAPDEIANKLGKKKLFTLLCKIRRQIDAEELLLSKDLKGSFNEKGEYVDQPKSLSSNIMKVWSSLSPVSKNGTKLLLLLICLFIVFVQCNLPMIAGGIGTCICLNVLFLIIMKREQKWVNEQDSLEYRQNKKRELRRLRESINKKSN